MGTHRTPPIIMIQDALQHKAVALRVSCFCGRAIDIPILLAQRKFGRDAWLADIGRRFRCKECKGKIFGDLSLATSVTPLWRRAPRTLRQKDQRPRLGPCE